MTQKRLGKGLNAIIPEFPEGVEQVFKIAEVELARVRVNPLQPRKDFSPEAMQELMLSIKEKGVIQPITVRQVDDAFELIAGERRLRACQQLGLATIPAYVFPVKNEAEMLELALIENVQRENLNPVDEAQAYRILAETFDLSHEEIAQRVGKDRSTITNALRLLNLPEPILKDLRAGVLSAGHARPILALPTPKQQLNVWQRIKHDGLSVRAVENLVRRAVERGPQVAPPKTTEPTLMLKHATEQLIHILGTKVKIKGSENKGVIEIEFYSREDLARLMEIFNSIKD
jgi:ParB family chromosome partitioning protein